MKTNRCVTLPPAAGKAKNNNNEWTSSIATVSRTCYILFSPVRHFKDICSFTCCSRIVLVIRQPGWRIPLLKKEELVQQPGQSWWERNGPLFTVKLQRTKWRASRDMFQNKALQRTSTASFPMQPWSSNVVITVVNSWKAFQWKKSYC